MFLACLALGVTVIAAVGSVSESVQRGLAAQSTALLGGDLSLRIRGQALDSEVVAALARFGTVSEITSMRAMAGPENDPVTRTLVELKAVDSAYPLYGAVTLRPQMALDAALEERDGTFGVVTEAALLDRLGLSVGDKLTVGNAALEVRAVIEHEPDRAFSTFTLGPRLMISRGGLNATGLDAPGSLIRRAARLRLDSGITAPGVKVLLAAEFPDAPWRVRDTGDAAPGLRGLLGRMQLFLTLVGLTALLIGGLGVAMAVDGYLSAKRGAIAVLKSLGAERGLVLRIYLSQVLTLAAMGTALGLVVGAALPFALTGFLSDLLGVQVQTGVYAKPLLTALGFGLLTAGTFALPPLLRARGVKPADLLRSAARPRAGRLGWRERGLLGLAAAVLAGFALATANDSRLTIWFLLGVGVAFALLLAASAGMTRLATRLSKFNGPHTALGLRGVGRSPATTAAVLLSLGLGLTVLVTIGLIQGNLRQQVDSVLPEVAPSYFFVDIQPAQVEEFDRLTRESPGVGRVERRPMLRARITAIAGVPVAEAQVDQDVSWAVRGDRGMTVMAEQSKDDTLSAGAWWTPEQFGEPLLSLTADLAEGFGVSVGDTLTLNVLGRVMTLTIANLRDVEWTTLAMNFSLVLPPGLVDGAPQTHLATLYMAPDADPNQEEAVFRAVTAALPNVTAVRIREALDSVSRLLGGIGAAVGLVAAVTLIAGLLVLTETLRAQLRQRRYEAVLLKTVGATRRDVLAMLLTEQAFLGLAAGLVAVILGGIAAWLVVTKLMNLPQWSFLPATALAIAAGGLGATLLLSLRGMRRALGAKPWSMLRNE